jgi:hypothetical protein
VFIGPLLRFEGSLALGGTGDVSSGTTQDEFVTLSLEVRSNAHRDRTWVALASLCTGGSEHGEESDMPLKGRKKNLLRNPGASGFLLYRQRGCWRAWRRDERTPPTNWDEALSLVAWSPDRLAERLNGRATVLVFQRQHGFGEPGGVGAVTPSRRDGDLDSFLKTVSLSLSLSGGVMHSFFVYGPVRPFGGSQRSY